MNPNESKGRRAALLLCVALLLSGAWGAGAAAARQGAGWISAQRGTAGKDLNAVFFADSERGWAAGDGGLVLHTRDGGDTWTRQNIGTSESVSDVFFRNKEDGYLLAGSEIYVTEDSGKTWRLSARFPAATYGGTPDLYSVRFTSKKNGWVVGSLSRRERVYDSLVIQTTNGGTAWNRVHVPVKDELIHLDFDGEKRGWIVGSAGRILHTDDGGRTWATQDSNTRATLYHVDFTDDRHGWAVGERGTILRTDDGGRTWQQQRSPLNSTLLSVKFVNDEEGWAVGRGGVILRTDDGGRSWVRQETNTRQHIYALHFSKNQGWAVGGDGLVFRYER